MHQAGADHWCSWLAEIFIPLNSMSVIKTRSASPSSSPPGTFLEHERAYHPHVFYEDIEWESHDCMMKEPSTLAYDIANPFPPDL